MSDTILVDSEGKGHRVITGHFIVRPINSLGKSGDGPSCAAGEKPASIIEIALSKSRDPAARIFQDCVLESAFKKLFTVGRDLSTPKPTPHVLHGFVSLSVSHSLSRTGRGGSPRAAPEGMVRNDIQNGGVA